MVAIFCFFVFNKNVNCNLVLNFQNCLIYASCLVNLSPKFFKFMRFGPVIFQICIK